MFDAIKNIFHNEHDCLLTELETERATFEKADAQLIAEQESLETQPLGSIRQFDETRQAIEETKVKRDKAKIAYQMRRDSLTGRIRASAPAVIDQAIRRLADERERTAQALRVRAFTENNAAGVANGFVDSNSPKIQHRLAAIDAARQKLETLKIQRVADIAAAVREIENAVPELETDTERFECSAAVDAHIGD